MMVSEPLWVDLEESLPPISPRHEGSAVRFVVPEEVSRKRVPPPWDDEGQLLAATVSMMGGEAAVLSEIEDIDEALLTACRLRGWNEPWIVEGPLTTWAVAPGDPIAVGYAHKWERYGVGIAT